MQGEGVGVGECRARVMGEGEDSHRRSSSTSHVEGECRVRSS